GSNLPEAVQHPMHTEVRGAGGPGRPEARGREHGDGGLRQVGQEPCDSIALSDTGGPQPRGDARDLAAQLAVSELPARAALVDEHDGSVIIVVPQEVFREVEPGVGEEPRAGHAARILEHRAHAPVGADVGKPRELRPELLRMRYRPGVYLLVPVELHALARIQAGSEPRQVGGGDASRRWAPDLAHGALATE